MGFISHITNTQVGNSKTGKTHSATLFLRIQVISASLLCCLQGTTSISSHSHRQLPKRQVSRADMIIPPQNRGWREVTVCKYFFHSKNNSMAVHATAPRKNLDPIELAGSYNRGQIRSLGKRIKV